MIFHSLFNRHAPDLQASHWEGGRFVTSCVQCSREMVKPPGQQWQLASRASTTASSDKE